VDDAGETPWTTTRKPEQVKTRYSPMIQRTNQLAPDYRSTLLIERHKLVSDAAPLPSLLFHYTTAEACFSILNSKSSDDKLSLWASSAFCMNDASEIIYGLKLIDKVAREFIPQEFVDQRFTPYHETPNYAMLGFLEDTCVACFCAAPDLLSQWRIYGREGAGYSIGFEPTGIQQANRHMEFDLIPIIYNPEHQEQLTRAYFTMARQLHDSSNVKDESHFYAVALDSAVKLSLLFKNESFSEEKEWRLVSVRPGIKPKYRSSRWGIVPYVEIPVESSCIREVWQGPTLDHDLTERTLRMYLKSEYGIDCHSRKTQSL
jgi:hypothetical protein